MASMAGHHPRMRLGHFDMNLLFALDALLDSGSVTAAAQRLGMAQSSTSSALARLREHFGDELLVPVGRRMELTSLARALRQPVREILLKAESAVQRRPSFDPASSTRRFRVRASDYATSVLLAPVVRRLAREAPGVQMRIANMSPDVPEQLQRGEVDLVIYPEEHRNPALPHQALFEDVCVCVIDAAHPVIGDTIDAETYFAHGHVAWDFGDDRLAAFEEMIAARHGRRRRIDVVTTNFNTLPQLVAGTPRIATVFSRLGTLYAHYLPLRVLPMPLDLPPLRELMQWHRHADDDAAHAWLRQVIYEEASRVG